jgi:KTSC domain-containing protein
MKRHFVKSTAIRTEGYDQLSQVLELEYTNGAIYQYFPVPPEIYQEFKDAESKGTFVNRHIKPNYQCREIRRRTA